MLNKFHFDTTIDISIIGNSLTFFLPDPNGWDSCPPPLLWRIREKAGQPDIYLVKLNNNF
jgi:hypothetical protein